MATLAIGITGYIEIPIKTVKPSFLRFFDIYSLIQSAVHTYHPQIIEPNYVHYPEMKQMNKHFEVIHIDLYQEPIFNSFACKVKPSQKNSSRGIYNLVIL